MNVCSRAQKRRRPELPRSMCSFGVIHHRGHKMKTEKIQTMKSDTDKPIYAEEGDFPFCDPADSESRHVLIRRVRNKYRLLTLTLIERGIHITTMESCTSGEIASLITDTEGSSAVIKGALVTYSNEAKIQMGVPAEIIDKYGVYSTQTAQAMAHVCREMFAADIGIGITGSFGNADPANADSVPGEVWFSVEFVGHSLQAEKTQVRSFYCEVPRQPDRHAYKLYMAEKVVDEVKEILTREMV